MARIRVWWHRQTSQPEHASFVLSSKVVQGQIVMIVPIGTAADLTS